MKSEPDVYSIEDLKREKTTWWEGVRNYQARNFMTKDMQLGDQFLFYHSNAEPPGVAGLGHIVHQAQPDPSALNKRSEYYEPRATKDNPVWFCVQVAYDHTLPHFVALEEIRKHPQLKRMVLLKPGSRLSISPVTPEEFQFICQLGGL